MPSVRVAGLSGSRSFASGATIAHAPRSARRIGGFASIANQLADDYRLGELTRQHGAAHRALRHGGRDAASMSASLGDLVRHELRWLRTIRSGPSARLQPFVRHLRRAGGRPREPARRRRVAGH